jgi:hypothetical protein
MRWAPSWAFVLGVLAATAAGAHSQEPGYKKIYAQDVATQTYTLENAYTFPATYEIEILDRDGRFQEGEWKLLEGQRRYRLEPGSSRRFSVLINMKGRSERKLLVCTTLKAVGYEESLPGNITRVCSRLWVISPG